VKSLATNANDRQVGGDHYKGAEYQHWDWAHECKLHGLAWTASKYVARHRRKNGAEDLGKALHYYDKAQELGVQGSIVQTRMAALWRFVLENGLTVQEAMICYYIMEGEWEAAHAATTILLNNAS
jgi:hypothetical protein